MRDRDERDQRDQESPSGAMRGSGRGRGSPDMPYPVTDAEDTGLGDGGLPSGDRDAHAERSRVARDVGGLGADESPPDDTVPHAPSRSRSDDARDRAHGGWGDEGIGGGRAGGTGI